MWFVTNKENEIKLKRFEEKVILPFFEELSHYKKSCFLGSFEEYFKMSSNYFNKSNQKIFSIISHRKFKNLKLSQYMDNIVNNFSESKIEYYYMFYKSQNAQVNNGVKNITFESIPSCFNIIFNDFFYKKFFSDDKIWNAIDGCSFYREIFHKNFKRENDLVVCPYCDLDTTINTGNNHIEHFLPKSLYPFLSMNALNLISSCPSCNLPYEGKGAKFQNPVTSPFIEQIGESIEFNLDVVSQKILISSLKIEVENYLYLLNLKKRYQKELAFTFLIKRGESLYTSMLRYENEENIIITSNDIIKIIEMEKANDKKQIPLYFATINIFSDYDRYIATKKRRSQP